MFDGQVVRPPREFREAARNYVCVRVTNINDVDLNAFPFDFDLTMAILLANADGTVYHRYGGRAHLSPMSMEGLVDLMNKGLESHEEYVRNPSPPERQPPQFLPQLVNQRLKGVMQPLAGCFHCHYAREARQLMELEAGTWTPDKFWIYPAPERIGMVMEQSRQYRVSNVIPGSPAEAAGIKSGDLLQSLGGKRILTKYDIQSVLDKSDGGAIRLPFTLLRDTRLLEGELALDAGWKVGDPDEYSWRVENPFTAHMVKFLPAPGFTGKRLSAGELKSLGLPEDRFALRVSKLNYGPHRAGIRLGDVILSAGGKSDFKSTRDFYAWCESLRRQGRDIKIQVRREGYEMGMMVSLSYLNYSRVEKAPRVAVGFIPQQLPGGEGVRVGHVTEGSGAEQSGLRLGDRIVSVNGEAAPTYERLTNLLDRKSPGELLLINVTRDGQPLEFSFVLPGEDEAASDLARLSGRVTHAGQELTCVVTIKLPSDKHLYSVHKKGFGQPTRVEFRGRGYQLTGGVKEPPPREIADAGGERQWILEGDVELKQRIRITDPAGFQLLLRVYAQVCDDKSCHEFRAALVNDGADASFSEYRGDFDRQPALLPRE